MEDFIIVGFTLGMAFLALKWVAITCVLPAALKFYFWLSVFWDYVLNCISFLWRISPWIAVTGITLLALKRLLNSIQSKFSELKVDLGTLRAENEKNKYETQRLDQLIVSLQKRCDAITHHVTRLEGLAESLQTENPTSTHGAKPKPSKLSEPNGLKGEELIRNVLKDFKRGY
jgi:hypothetical protein